MSNINREIPEIKAEGWLCQKCGKALEPMETEITYVSSSFKIELPGCRDCGFIFIPPELALGKMLEVEKLLEDK
ncbi:DNA-binding protein [Deltaproteobacteria bacterium OttesenSCG-928-K17]|nr:DNA-binding protein [Deltaproteobacteria bacterium OttesenSCG-928-K17]